MDRELSTVFPAHSSGLGALQVFSSLRHGGKDKERGNILFQA